MMKKTVHSFKNKASLGVDRIPMNSIVEIENFDGLNNSILLSITDKTGLIETSTVEDLLLLNNQIISLVPNVEIPYSFEAFDSSAVVELFCDGTDYLLTFLQPGDLITISAPRNILLGTRGIIAFNGTGNMLFQTDGSSTPTEARNLQYTVLPDGKVHISPL